MGAPKQKWTADEEAALKAGVIKHGAGKWRTILKDPEYSGVLYLRSNVDLKDKWRNMSVMAHGWSSREKSKLVTKRVHNVPKREDAVDNVKSDEEAVDIKALEAAAPLMQIPALKRSAIRLDNLIIEAITTLKEPDGSNKTAIASYIEEQYWPPQDFKRILSAKLKHLTSAGKLIKVKRKYRIAPTSFTNRKRSASMLLLDGRQRVFQRAEREEFNMPTKAQLDVELSKMRTMSAQEAEAVAARAVAEAENAIAEAEEAAREAEAAEADAEAAQAFAEAAMKTIKGRNNAKTMRV
ncbi:Telomere repeat-binding factor 1 [Linum perenne]